MTLRDFRTTLLEKSLNRTELPDDTKLRERIWTGLKIIAKETIPLSLIVQDRLGFAILRRIDDTTYIRIPDKPTQEDLELDTDDRLIDALSYYVMAGFERGNAKQHMAFYHQEIDFNNDLLVETALTESTNESYHSGAYV